MLAELQCALIIIVAGISLYSWQLGRWLKQLGFSHQELRGMLRNYDERVQTQLGKLARTPLLVTHARDAWQQGIRFMAPMILNTSLLGWAYTMEPTVLHWPLWWPAVLIVVGMEWFAFQYLQQMQRAHYQTGFEEYLRLTAPENVCLEGILTDYSLPSRRTTASHFLDRGKLIQVAWPGPDGGTLTRSLHKQLGRPIIPVDQRKVRVFYRPDVWNDLTWSDEYIGWQDLPLPVADVNSHGLERMPAEHSVG